MNNKGNEHQLVQASRHLCVYSSASCVHAVHVSACVRQKNHTATPPLRCAAYAQFLFCIHVRVRERGVIRAPANVYGGDVRTSPARGYGKASNLMFQRTIKEKGMMCASMQRMQIAMDKQFTRVPCERRLPGLCLFSRVSVLEEIVEARKYAHEFHKACVDTNAIAKQTVVCSASMKLQLRHKCVAQAINNDFARQRLQVFWP